MHRRRGFGIFYWGRVYHVGYHYMILPNGTVEKGRPDGCRGAHTTGYNSYIGVCLVGNFSSGMSASDASRAEEPTEAQLKALVELCRRVRNTYRIPARNVVTHREVNVGTECPGDRFPFEKVAEAFGKDGE
jgi:N-acetyl-anhydromuramyl-L-alanine amidase AmpD